ncbi:MAG: hypothetical protein MK212_00375 [Saprospiraceae bacterium]|nr:hypothetical protein [Saprospiraceae bacterium]
MKTLTYIFLIGIFSVTLFSCGGGESAPVDKGTAITEYLKPVATFMKETPGVQLFSFFDTDKYKKEKVKLNGQACVTGSYGKKPMIALCAVDVDGTPMEARVIVSPEDRDKVQDALKKAEKESKGEVESLEIIFEGTMVKEGSNKSPFGDELQLNFDEGKLIAIVE